VLRRCLPVLLLCAAPIAHSHEIPNDVTLQMYVKAEGSSLRVLVRVPFNALRDINFPERGQGFLDLEQTAPILPDAARLWVSDFIQVYEGKDQLPQPRVAAARIALPDDRSFASYDQAIAHFSTPPPGNNVQLYWNQPSMDVLFEYPIRSATDDFSIRPGGLARLGLRVVSVLRFVLADGTVRALEYEGDPGIVRLDPHWYQAAARFVQLGFDHILDGTDHLLFLFCLVIPLRRFRDLIPVVTAFTIAHSITLIASAYGLAPNVLWFPPMIEVGIAISIVYMALENIVMAGKHQPVLHRALIAFGFGLVHGFGFSFALRETLQFAGRHMLASLLSFNIGVEIGQLLVLIIMIPLLELLFRYVVSEKLGTIILSALVAHTAWHWMLDRWTIFSKYRVEWTPELIASLLKWAIFALAVGGGIWWIRSGQRKPEAAGDREIAEVAEKLR
jgi:hypothetical protein